MVEFCTIKRALAAYRADGADDDTDPDRVAVQGKVTLTPVLSTGAVTMWEDGALVTVPLQSVEARIQNGRVRYRGAEGVRVVAGGQGMNPAAIVYKATFSEMQAGGWSFKLPAIQFEAVPGGEVDLTLVAPAPNAPDGIVRGPAGTSISDVLVDGADLVVMVTDEAGTRELSRLPLDDVVAAEAEAAAQSVKDALAAELGDASESASKAKAEADRADARATAADASATAAAADASATAADRVKTTADATATAADRVATAADRVATGQARSQTWAAADRAAGSATTATSQADRATTEADRAQAAADSVDTEVIRQEVTSQIAAVVDGAPEDLDTIREVAEYAQENRTITDTLNAAIGQKADKTHTHTVTEVTGLQGALDGKAPTVHTHTADQVAGLDAALGAKLDASKIQVVSMMPANPVAGTIYLVTGGA